MTLNNGAKIIHKVTGVTSAELYAIAADVRDSHTAAEGNTDPAVDTVATTSRRPAIDIDARLMACRWASLKSGFVKPMLELCNAIAGAGIDVYLVDDGKLRHPSKRSSFFREAERREIKESSFQAMTAIHYSRQMMCTADAEERTKLEAVVNKLEHFVTSAEKKMDRALPSDFYDKLQSAVAAANWAPGGGSVTLLRAEQQADTFIAYRRIHGLTDLVWGNDGDYHIFSGSKSLSAKDFKLKKGELSDITLASGSRGIIVAAAEKIGIDVNEEKGRFSQAEIPLLDGEGPRMRALISVALGCDAYTGCTGMTPAKVRDALKGITGGTQSRFDAVLNALSLSSGLSADIILVFVDVMMYEPAHEEGKPRAYMHGAPTHRLARYISDFSASAENVCDGPAMRECAGAGSRSHTYISAEGGTACAGCGTNLCPTCHVNSNKVDNMIRVARGEAELPRRSVCIGCLCGDTISPDGALTIGQMKEKLEKVNVGMQQGLGPDTTNAEIYRFYEIYILDKKGSILDEIVDGVEQPLLSAQCLSPGRDDSLDCFLNWDLAEGGSFMQHEDLTIDQLVKLADLFASFLIMDTNPSKENKKYASVLSKNMLAVAEAIRDGEAYRIKDRTIRHGRDSHRAPITEASVSFFPYMEDIGMIIRHRVPPSFKNINPYETVAAFTKNALVACKCSCDAGAEEKCDHDRHADVHVLPLALGIKDLLLDPDGSLAESILTSLAARWPADDGGISSECRATMAAAIATLASATIDCKANFTDRGQSIHDMLATWDVGTEREKAPPAPMDPKHHDLLRNFKLQSNAKKDPYEGRSKTGDATDGGNNGAETNQGGIDDATSNDGTSSTSLRTPGEYYNVNMACQAWAKERGDSSSSILKKAIGPRLVGEHSVDMPDSVDKAVVLSNRNEIRKAQAMENERSRSRKGIAADEVDDVMDTQEEPEQKKQRPNEKLYYCNFGRGNEKCRCHHRGPPSDFSRLAPCPKNKLPGTVEVTSKKQRKAENSKRKTYGRRLFVWKENLRRIGVKQKDAPKDTRICSRHPKEHMKLSYSWTDVDGKSRSATTTRWFPMAIGGKSVRSTIVSESASKGLGRDRYVRSHLEKSSDERLPVQQISTMSEDDDVLGLNDSVSIALGTNVHAPELGRPMVREIPVSGIKRAKAGDAEPKDNGPPPPIVNSRTLSDKEAKRCTGFPSAVSLLCYITTICNAEFDIMTTTVSEMTWFEEWYLYCEVVWGKSCARWIDFEKKYKLSRKVLTRVFLNKLALVLKARDSWPRYASLEEDEKLRGERWNLRYKGQRIVFWDGTNVNLPKPSDSDLQRLTYSKYYGGNVGKGQVFLQLSGYGGVEELLTGGICDTDSMDKNNIFKKQEEFVNASADPDIAFMNVLDKGYRCVLAALRAGGQSCLQPVWKRSDRKFTSKELLVSAAIAADRAANERMVNVMKRSGFIQRGVKHHQSLEVFADFWLAWSFQANFMFEPVL